nr:asparagine synthase (glutamine-hydrolyzing) [Bdellovibrio sp. CKG001]
MCGIAALINLEPHSSDHEVLNMTDTISHRGPDGSGTFVEGRVALGHRRLSIVDLSDAGAQPMHFQNRYVITYNGEVYNHHELREELESLGHRFSSMTDTEVILAAYAAWGKECLHKFNGMWAFVIYDRDAQTVFAARDRFGVKPLYYWVSPKGDQCAFVSEIKQLTVLSSWQARANPQRCYDFLRYGVLDHTNETMFEGVLQLRGGQALHAKLTEFNCGSGEVPGIYQWYDLEQKISPYTGGSVSQVFGKIFDESIGLRMRADVPVGSCLSGGLDSSSIVCTMSKLLAKNGGVSQQMTFSACAKMEKYDERRFIDQVVAETGVNAHYTYPDFEELFPMLSKLTWHQDEPFGSTSVFAQWKVFKLASENSVKVMLDGQGADEQLIGYHSFFGTYWAELLKKGRLRLLWKEYKAARIKHKYTILGFIKRLVYHVLPMKISGALVSIVKGQDQWGWLKHDRLGAARVNPLANLSYFSSTHKMSVAQMLSTSVPMLLHWEDRDSMAHGVEARVPFLDYRLVEFTMGLPPQLKLRDGVTKSVLREAMKDRLPRAIGGRMDKMGFVTPEEHWVREIAPKEFRDALNDAIDRSNGVVGSEILEQFDKMLEGRVPYDFLFWRIISFGVWVRVFGVKVGRDA